ncbi:MAG: NAD(P)/FAD-dependent oxidoreductase [Cellulomonas iranensis]|nr:NAD(P)-binding domain-containing protein [Cellulomonas iranensis]MBO9568977.1 NAD(P)/FAD-dependent oxidoreductase [Cellulomonas iranensis]
MSSPAVATAAPGGRRARRRADGPRTVDVDVVVVGAGQAGLSAAYHLHRTGLVPVGTRGWERARGTFVVLDDNPRAGGAWQHRWRSLTMADAHHVHDLPGMPLAVVDAAEPAADAVPYYFAQYEEAFGLNVQRPVRVTRVTRGDDVDGEPRYAVETQHVDHPDARVVWSARGVVNASGTWNRPFWPSYPGRADFRGRQLHARDFRTAQELADGHVVVVGGGTSAVQLLLQVAEVTTTTWVTRRPPRWVDAEFTPELGREAVARVEERVRAGLPPESVVSVTDLPLTPAYRAGIASGVLRARPAFSRMVADGVVWDEGAATGAWRAAATPDGDERPDGRVDGDRGVRGDDDPGARGDGDRGARGDGEPGRERRRALGVPHPAVDPDLGAWVDGPSFVPARTVLWATGFRASLDHLAPLGLRGPGGGIAMDGTEVVAEPRVQLVGYGPSASTVGANRAGREAARRLRRHLRW